MAIETSRDARHWETAENHSFGGNESGPATVEFEPSKKNANRPASLDQMWGPGWKWADSPLVQRWGATVIQFSPRLAKQIRVAGRNFKRRLDKYVGGARSANSKCGMNSARTWHCSRGGAGVTVPSTSYLMNYDRLTQEFCFTPVEYDLGPAHIRVGAGQWAFLPGMPWNAKRESLADPGGTGRRT
ncbi:MAG: hypothetical protein U0V70_15155 [Terriglobia bacterium]